MKRTLLFIVCVLTSFSLFAQEEPNEYFPFVKEGKRWHVVRSDFDSGCHFETYVLMNEEIVKNGKTYMKMYRTEDILSVVYDAGLFREEGCKVYYYDSDMQKEYLMFDFSLKEGDTYETYSSDEQKMMTYKVLSVGDYTEGPEIVSYDYNQTADTIVTQHRYLRQWTVCREDNESIQKTWIEGVGSLEGPLENLHDVVLPDLSKDYLAYVEYNDFDYLPFSFYDEFNHIHGCDLPKGNAGNWDDLEDGWHHQLTFELEGDRLHVYGKALLMCGLYHYAYFTEEQTDDPLVRKLRFKMLGIVQPANCEDLFDTDFYVPGFDPNMNYTVVDNFGEEHPVINKTPQMAYRPFVEEGKVWIVRVYPDGYDLGLRDDYWTEYYYFDGDTVIGGQTCKQMKYVTNANEENWLNGVFTPANCSQQYVGAWYEQDKKVYFAGNHQQQLELLYDFTLSSGDSIQSPGGIIMSVNKVSGGVLGFKGTYYDFCLDWGDFVAERWFEGVGSNSWPYVSHPYEFCGNQGVLIACRIGDEVIYYDSDEEDPYVMNARKRFDFTHTVKNQPKSRMRSRDDLSLYGEYNNLQLGINLDPLDDAYLVRITDDKGKAVYENAVNAGNIVGLNIDISTYAEGSYTVTMENSYESFTGIFETQTSGIEVVSNKNEEETSIFYNLQGQRLSSLQKGLNIVNGQKVYVK